MLKDFHMRFFSSIFLFFPLLLLFSKNNLIFLFIIQILLSLSLWEFFRLKKFKDLSRKRPKIEPLLLISRQKNGFEPVSSISQIEILTFELFLPYKKPFV